MNTKQLAIVSAIVLCVLAVIIVLLVTGGVSPEERSRDAVGDVETGEGGDPAPDTSIADIQSARVTLQDSQIVFQAEMGGRVPRKLEDQTMEWRWEILEQGTTTWVVSATVSVDQPVASLLQHETGFSASTIDDTLPGTISVSGDTITVTLDSADIEGFPSSFGWELTSTLDGDRADPASAVATDTAPDGGPGRVE